MKIFCDGKMDDKKIIVFHKSIAWEKLSRLHKSF